MRFLFVDRIDEIGTGRISGVYRFPSDSPMAYDNLEGGDRYIAPGAISEAIGQLASWLCISRNSYAARPVFLFVDAITINFQITPGTEVTLTADILQMDSETMNFSGTASVGGQIAQTITNCNCYFVPLADLEDPELSRQRFKALTSGGLNLGANRGQYPFGKLIDSIVKGNDRAAVAKKTFGPDEPFFADHFPRMPIVPIVMLNEMIGQATKNLFDRGGRLTPISVEKLKIRKFIRPSDPCEVKVCSVETDGPNRIHQNISTIAEVYSNQRRIVRGRYTYRWHTKHQDA